MINDKARILIVDDDEASLATLEAFLVTYGFIVHKARSGADALKKVVEDSTDLILLDLLMPGVDGFEVSRRLKSDPERCGIPIIAVTALHDRQSNLRALECGVDGFLTKPFDEAILRALITNMLNMKRLKTDLETSQGRLENISEYHRRFTPGRSRFRKIVGTSDLIEKVRARIDMVKNSEVPVLILGESGTGKQLVAEALHWEGNRAGEPFVQVNCASLQESLLESELFGHAKGAYTGAVTHKKGLIQVAQRGSLFVDEVGDMSLAVQAKFLTVLDTGLFRRLGDTQERMANVRIIAATNRNLKEETDRKRFRLDMYYRLSGVDIHVPPLRQHKEDIPLLVEYFLAGSRLTPSSNKRFSTEAMEVLQEYDWPGNVRELRNVVESAIVFSQRNEVITPRRLPSELAPPGRKSNRGLIPMASDSMTLADMAIVYIREVLKREHGNRTRAAKILGISRSTLKKKIADNPALRDLSFIIDH
ncbi:MAG: sigma-54-dependent Fis family transcriptional regulator [Desulfobacterales bacterium]|nr:sigma-54-dependent Fis family transcriptional regulator [Desulfobacterales bacterium]